MFTASFEINVNKTINFISEGLEYFIPEPETLPGKTIDTVTNFIPVIRKFINPALKGERFELQVPFTFPDKRQREIRVYIDPVLDRDHLISSVLFILMELKPDKHVKKTKPEYTKKDLLSLLESTPEGIVVIDKSWVIRFMNPVAEKILGKSRNELTGTEYPYRLTGRKKKEVGIGQADGTLHIIEMQSSLFAWEEKPAQIIYLKDISAERIIRDGLMNVITDAVVFLDNEGKPRYYNKPFSKVFDISGNHGKVPDSIIEHVSKHLTKEKDFRKKVTELLSTDETFLDTLHHVEGWVFEWFSRPVFMHKKRIGRIMSFHDITRQEITEKYILRQNRLYATLSGINQMLVRSASVKEMAEETCRIAVEEGDFKTAWIAMVDKDADKIEILSASGKNMDLPRNFSGRLSEAVKSGLPAAKACITGKSVIINDLRKKSVPGKWRFNALKLHFYAMAVYPLRVKGKILGSFTVCTDETGIFDKKGKDLLKEIAMDISFSIETLENETARKKAEEKLIQREKVLEVIARYSLDSIAGKSLEELLPGLLKDIGSRLNVDRAYYFKIHKADDGTLLASQLNEWVGKDIAPQFDNPELQNIPLLAAGYERWVDLLSKGKPVYGLVKDFPESEHPLLESQDILSILVLPVKVNRKLWGFIGFDHCKTNHKWTKQEMETLSTLASLTGSLIFRDEAEKQLREREYRLTEAQEVAGLGYWELELRTNRLAWSGKIYELFDVMPETFAGTYEAFLELVHPDDRTLVDRAYRESVENKKSYSIVHRVVDKSGRIKWVWEKGQSFYDSEGKALRTVGTVMDVTERESAREEISRLSRVVEEGPASVVITDVKGRIVFVNRRFTEFTGYTIEEAIGKSPGQLVKSGYHDESFYKNMWKTILSGKKWMGEIYNKRKDGSMFWVSSSISALKNSRGDITYYAAVNEDITEKKEIEKISRVLSFSATVMEEAMTKEELFSRVTEELKRAGLIGFFAAIDEKTDTLIPAYISIDHKLILLLEKLTGLQFKKIPIKIDKLKFLDQTVRKQQTVFSDQIAEGIARIMPPDVKKYTHRIVKMLHISKGILAPVILENRVLGVFQLFGDDLRPVLGPYVSALANQIALSLRKVNLLEELRSANIKLKIALEKLKDSEQKYREFFEKDISANYISTPEGKILDCNPSFIYMFGFQSKKQALSKNMSDFYPDTKGRIRFIKLLEEKKSLEYYDQDFITVRGKKRHTIKNAFGKFDSNGKLTEIRAYLWDITKLKKTEEKLVKALEKAQESERLKTAFLTNMSHEIRTPINAIVGFSTLLGEKDILPAEREEYLRIINANVSQLLNLLDDIINLAKIETGQISIEYESLDLHLLLKDFYRTFSVESRLKEKNIHLVLDPFPKKKLVIQGNRVRIQEIFGNLLSNAIKFTPAGSIHFGYELAGEDMLRFYVRDTGIGIPAHLQKVIFERFRQADNELTREYEGTGLGLAISKSYVKLMGGEIWVKSVPGKGSTFYFTLPVNQQKKQTKQK